jgi:ketosteroid isomerase-like protein
MLSESVEIVIRFITAINSHNIDLISEMMSDDHKFTDSLGSIYRGKDLMTRGWTNYLKMFPDYKIDIDEIFNDGEKIIFTGKASGTYMADKTIKENHWEINAAWRALVINDKIKEWQVFGDNKPVYETIERNKR